MFYYLYQITNLVNNKIYVGVHKTNNMNDGYMGSGKIIRSAIDKHGLANFSKVILETFENAEAMYAREAEVVNDEFLLREDVYNLRRGGHGGFDHLNKTGLNNSTKSHDTLMKGGLKTKLRWETDKEFSDAARAEMSILRNKEYKDGTRTSCFSDPKVQRKIFEKSQTPEVILKRNKTRRERKVQTGEKNSQFGTTWVWHEQYGNKKIKKELLQDYIDQGWYKTYKPGYKI